MSRFLRLSLALTCLLLLGSCATYNGQIAKYYNNLQQGNLEKAATALDNNKLLKKDRNRLLFLLERGKVCHMLNQWDSSNTYLNEADAMIEDARNTARDVIAGTLINPMMKSYRAEDFEKYLVHYYKAINYLQLGQPDEALVEARRITLQENAQEDKVGNRDKYSEDPFANIIQGILYERSNDINNAFIAYRNAADVYLRNDGSYYGTSLPAQLRQDVLRTAALNGFQNELDRYSGLFGETYQPTEAPAGGELILFWENGSAPVKVQQDLYFALVKNAGGGFFFNDPNGLYNIPFNSSNYSNDDIQLTDLRSFRVAIPRYEERPPLYGSATLQLNGSTYQLQQAEDINTLAFTTLKERMVKELTETLARLAVKKIAEAAVRGKEAKEDPKKTPEQKKKEEKEQKQREALALGLQLLNFATEKADTRNWQSLPHSISYVRVPLVNGVNKVSVLMNGRAATALNGPAVMGVNGPSAMGPAGLVGRTIDLQVTGTGRLQVINVNTLQSID